MVSAADLSFKSINRHEFFDGVIRRADSLANYRPRTASYGQVSPLPI